MASYLGAAIGFLNFCEARNRWSAETFGSREERGPIGPLKHLEKEAREAYTETDPAKQREEIADTMFLVLDAAWRAGMTLEELTDECERKLAKNQTRTWPRPVDDEPVEHVRE